MVRVVTYYFPQCPLHTNCSAASWTRLKRCGSSTLEDAKAKLVNHLVNSKLHYADDATATELAESASFEMHESDDDLDEEDTLAAATRSRPLPRSRPSSIRERSRSPALPQWIELQDGAEAARRATKQALDASRHAKRLSLSAAAAYETEIKRLELALEDLKELV